MGGIKMKKYLSIFPVIILALIVFLTGCSAGNSGDETLHLDYDVLLQMPKSYVSIADKVSFESLTQYKEFMFKQRPIQGAFVTLESIDTVFYVTVWHDGGEVYTAGKAVTRCKITDVGETFNGYTTKKDSVIEIEQDYYIEPIDEKDALNMFESFGAVFTRDFFGEIVKMELEEGDYLLKIQKDVKYELKLYDDVLPMESGKTYTGVLKLLDGKNTVDLLSPLEETDRYDAFRMSSETKKLAAEVQAEVLK